MDSSKASAREKERARKQKRERGGGETSLILSDTMYFLGCYSCIIINIRIDRICVRVDIYPSISVSIIIKRV